MSRWDDVKAALREMFHPAPLDDEPDTTTPEVIKRWVEGHRHPAEGSES